MWIVPVVLCALLYGCSFNSSVGTSENYSSKSSGDATPLIRNSHDERAPKQSEFVPTTGLLLFKERDQILKSEGGLIRIYDEDGEVWLTINYYDDKYTAISEPNGLFRPFEFQVGDFALKLRCLEKSENWYKVVVQEESVPKAIGYVKVSDPLFEFQTWEAFVLGIYNLTFDQKENPVYERPHHEGKMIEFIRRDDLRIVPVELNGEWLRIQWPVGSQAAGRVRSKGKEVTTGWIRWKRHEQVLVGELNP